MKREYKEFLYDILNSICEILEYTKNLNFEDFRNDKKTIHAVTRCFTIMGEATTYLPQEFKEKYNDIPWRDIKDFRNIIVHKYWGVEIIDEWTIIKEELTKLKENIERIIKIEF